MKFPVKTTIALLALGGVGAAIFLPAQKYLAARNRPIYRQAEVTRGPIIATVSATGTIQPVLTVSVGTFVSGPITELNADFNTEVKKGQLLAKIDPRLYDAAVKRDRASLKTREAEVERAKALLQQARNDEARALKVRKENKDFLSDTEMDQVKFNRMSLEAQLLVAEASVDQADANLKTSLANLEYTEIRSPVAGMVINRKIDEGQTLAAQFQTPELFSVAPDMRKKMHILATVDEADIGLIRQAKDRKLPVKFTVDAYPDDLFEGVIEQVRFSSTTTQNVVTYPVIVAAANPDLKLLPGMTASISFQVDDTKESTRIPNAALRYFPRPEQVRPEDRKLLEGVQREERKDEDTANAKQTAADKAEARRNRSRRHVWLLEGDLLRAVPVVTGPSDNKNTLLVSGELKEGQQIVVGVQPRQ
jgi:HlyD family secretion protein